MDDCHAAISQTKNKYIKHGIVLYPPCLTQIGHLKQTK
jgi:hypothetical protein